MAKPRISEADLLEKEEYRKFFKKLQTCPYLSYLNLFEKQDRMSVSCFLSHELTYRPISLAKLERLKQEALKNLATMYQDLTQGEYVDED